MKTNTRIAAAALLAAAAALPAHTQAQTQGPRNQAGLQLTPKGLANDKRSMLAATYDRDMGNGFALGGSVGYGDVHRADSQDGLYGVVRARLRLPGVPSLPWLQPQFGIEYGGASAIFRNAELWGAFAGVYMAASSELGFTLDLWAGRSRDEQVDLFGGPKAVVKRSVENLRLGVMVRF